MKTARNFVQKSATFLLGSALLSACAWPDFGQGGMDEVYSYERAQHVDPTISDGAGREHRLATRLDKLRHQIDTAWRGRPGKYRPAAMTMIEDQWNLAAREFAGGMHDDVEASLAVLARNFRALREEVRRFVLQKHGRLPASI